MATMPEKIGIMNSDWDTWISEEELVLLDDEDAAW